MAPRTFPRPGGRIFMKLGRRPRALTTALRQPHGHVGFRIDAAPPELEPFRPLTLRPDQPPPRLAIVEGFGEHAISQPLRQIAERFCDRVYVVFEVVPRLGLRHFSAPRWRPLCL